MDRQFIRPSKIAISFFLIFAVGCGYIDHDKFLVVKKIDNNFKLIKQENDTNVNLIFSETATTNAVVIQNCKRFFYDSARKSIYIESILNKYNVTYYEIHIFNKKTSSYLDASKQREINKAEFDSITQPLNLFFDLKVPN